MFWEVFRIVLGMTNPKYRSWKCTEGSPTPQIKTKKWNRKFFSKLRAGQNWLGLVSPIQASTVHIISGVSDSLTFCPILNPKTLMPTDELLMESTKHITTWLTSTTDLASSHFSLLLFHLPSCRQPWWSLSCWRYNLQSMLISMKIIYLFIFYARIPKWFWTFKIKLSMIRFTPNSKDRCYVLYAYETLLLMIVKVA
jgi:hypothetical protein